MMTGNVRRLSNCATARVAFFKRSLWIRIQDVDVTAIDEPLFAQFVAKVAFTLVQVEVTGTASGAERGEASGHLPNAPRRHARTWLPGGALVEGDPEDSDFGVECVEVRTNGRTQKSRDPDE